MKLPHCICEGGELDGKTFRTTHRKVRWATGHYIRTFNKRNGQHVYVWKPTANKTNIDNNEESK